MKKSEHIWKEWRESNREDLMLHRSWVKEEKAESVITLTVWAFQKLTEAEMNVREWIKYKIHG